MMRRLTAALCVAAFLAWPSAGSAARTRGTALSGLDLIELQIAYTTLIARYYRTLAPRQLVDGARTGMLAELYARGEHDAQLPYTPQRVSFGEGGDLVDGMLLRTLARYGERLDGHRLVEAAVAGELGSLHDPYTVLFRPAQFAKFDAFLNAPRFGGIGAVLAFDARGARATIESVVAGAPAQAAGLRAGDTLVAIDGRRVAALGAAGVRDALRGKTGTTVHLEVERGGNVRSYALVRALIRDPAVRTQRFGEVGYLLLSRFGDRAGADVATALAGLRAAGARAFVLDVRGNGGGYGDEATAVASAFIGAGPIFTTRERSGVTSVARASGRADFHAPLAVLVDGDTASAAEIVAGAVQDDRAGTLVGQRTFGKGLVQSIFPLPDGSALKVTTARYTTPAGRDIDRVGIVPDVVVPEPADSVRGDPAADPQLARALDIVRAATPQSVPR